MTVQDLQSPEVVQALKSYTVVYKDGEPVAVQLEISLFLRLLDALEDLITRKLPEESGVVKMLREARGRYLAFVRPRPLKEALDEIEKERRESIKATILAEYPDTNLDDPELFELLGSEPPLDLQDEKQAIIEAVTWRDR